MGATQYLGAPICFHHVQAFAILSSRGVLHVDCPAASPPASTFVRMSSIASGVGTPRDVGHSGNGGGSHVDLMFDSWWDRRQLQRRWRFGLFPRSSTGPNQDVRLLQWMVCRSTKPHHPPPIRVVRRAMMAYKTCTQQGVLTGGAQDTNPRTQPWMELLGLGMRDECVGSSRVGCGWIQSTPNSTRATNGCARLGLPRGSKGACNV